MPPAAHRLSPPAAGLRRFVQDIVDRWLALPDAERSRYGAGGSSDAGMLAHFGGDYCDTLERSAIARAGGDADDLMPGEEERLVLRCWFAHLRSLRRGGAGSLAMPDPNAR